MHALILPGYVVIELVLTLVVDVTVEMIVLTCLMNATVVRNDEAFLFLF